MGELGTAVSLKFSEKQGIAESILKCKPASRAERFQGKLLRQAFSFLFTNK